MQQVINYFCTSREKKEEFNKQQGKQYVSETGILQGL